MSFFSKLFGKSSQAKCEANKNTVKDFDAMSEAEKLQEVTTFIKANAEGGDPKYQYNLGVMYYTGQGPYGHGTFTQDLVQAKYWLLKSAAQGYPDAQCVLGKLYMESGDPTTAVQYYRMAAEQGHEAACENLALAYGMGEGVVQDKAEAHRWFLKAAIMGSAFAQYAVGMNYLNGDGVEEDAAESFTWLLKAAEQGQPDAQFQIGQIYEIGIGDIETARQWYTKAAAQGHTESQQKLQEQ